MLLGELLTLRQQRLPVNVVVLNNGALAFVELEMKANGITTYGTDLENPRLRRARRARSGCTASASSIPSELDDALRTAFAHDGPSVIDVLTSRQELSFPPGVTAGQAKGFALWATRSVLSGGGGEVLEVAATNLHQLAFE